MQHSFILENWSVWPLLANHIKDGPTQNELLSSIPKMLKRRLSPLAKNVFCAINLCTEQKSNIPIVFSSTHGELAKSFKMMQQIEAGEEISPTGFSLSVHNAIAGLFSIVYKNKIQSTVVAPGEEGIAIAFIEAIGLLLEGEAKVLMVFYDEPLVDFYPTEPYQLSSKESCAVALMISKTGIGTPLHFSCQPSINKENHDGEQPIQLPLLIRFLAEAEKTLFMHSPRHSWCWEKT